MTNPTSSTSSESRPSGSWTTNRKVIRVIQILSWIVTGIFLVALIASIYVAIVNGNSLPVWAWLGLLTLFAVAAGLVVMALVYRGVSREIGPFDFSSSGRVTGELMTEASHIEAGGASSLRASFAMAAGILRVSGGAADLMEADFTYDDATWKPPIVENDLDATGRATLAVAQKATGRPAMRQGRCEWSVRLGMDLPTELNIKFGAGKADLKLGGLNLTELKVESGVGELALDLSGEWERSLAATVKAGIGDTSIKLPHKVGVRVQSTVGFRSLHSRSLTRDGDAYTNDLFGESPVTLDIRIQGGMGKINLEVTGEPA
jgi:hypothetical protein